MTPKLIHIDYIVYPQYKIYYTNFNWTLLRLKTAKNDYVNPR